MAINTVTDDAVVPPGLTLYDFEDHDTHRKLIFDSAKENMEKQFPMTHNGVRMELSDVQYRGPEKFTKAEQKKAKITGEYLSKSLRGKVSLYDDKSGDLLDEKTITLMRVPYLSDIGTFIQNGSSFTSIAQARLMSGAFTRRKETGELETQFNARTGTGNSFRVTMRPKDAQYRLQVGGSDLHLYSLLKDIGVPDEELEKKWGSEILESNKSTYDTKVLNKAYDKLVPRWMQRTQPATNAEEKALRIKEALERIQGSTSVLKRTLPGMFDMQKSASLSKTEVKQIAWYLNKEGQAGINLDGSKESMEEAIKAFISQLGVNFDLIDTTSSLLGASRKEYANNVGMKFAAEVDTMFELDQDGEEYAPIGVNGILASTQKLLAVNKGEIPPDERDSLEFKKIYRTEALIGERIRYDAGNLRRNAMYQAARFKNLSGLNPFAFEEYIDRQIKGNPLTSASEELNPLLTNENSRRITLMGPGGLRSSQSITEEAQTVHPSQYGFISLFESPECHDEETQVFTKEGWVPWKATTEDTLFACQVNGQMEFHKPNKLIKQYYAGPMFGVRHQTLSFLVTPNHDLVYTPTHKRDAALQKAPAESLYEKRILLPMTCMAYAGDVSMKTFTLPTQPATTNNATIFEPFDIHDWCSLMGWFLSEGFVNTQQRMSRAGIPYSYTIIKITQSATANPENVQEIAKLFQRMGIKATYPKSGDDFLFSAMHISSYFKQFGHGCYHKWIPEELFDAPATARQCLLNSLLKGDGRKNTNDHDWAYSTVSKKLAEDVEKLALGLGYSVRLKIEKDNRPTTKTTNYCVQFYKNKFRTTSHGGRYGPYWYKVSYAGNVYCAQVPGGMLLTRRDNRLGVWSGNSERAGIDTRVANGVRLGSDGRLYQIVRNKRAGGTHQWMNPENLSKLTVGIPD